MQAGDEGMLIVIIDTSHRLDKTSNLGAQFIVRYLLVLENVADQSTQHMTFNYCHF